MTNLKILLIITKGEIGGAQISVLNLANGLKQKEHNVTIAFGNSGKNDFLKNKLKTEKINFVNFKNLLRTNNVFKNFLFIFEIKKFLDNNKFDIAHFNSANALFGAIGAKLSKNKPKTIFTVHGLSVLDKNYKTIPIRKALPISLSGKSTARKLLNLNSIKNFFSNGVNFFKKAMYYLFFKIFLKFIDKTIFVSNANFEYGKQIKLAKSSQLIYNGLDKNKLIFLDKNSAKKFLENKLNINLQNDFIIGSIGRLAYPKNYEFLITNFSEIKKVYHVRKFFSNGVNSKIKLIIIGDGPNKLKYQELIKKLNLTKEIFLVGELTNASKYLKAFDLFILPSIYEGLPITLLECLFAEIPMLASNVGGNAEIIEDKKYLYELDNKVEFLEKLSNIINNLDNFQINQEQKNKFTLLNMVKKYEEIYIN